MSKLGNTMNVWYEVSDGFFTFYVNKYTGAEKMNLDPCDILISRDEDVPAYNIFNN